MCHTIDRIQLAMLPEKLLAAVLTYVVFLSTAVSPASRKKRHVIFPEGSTFTFAFCMTLKAMTYGDIDIFSEAVAAAVNYDLPSNTSQTLLNMPKIEFPSNPMRPSSKYSMKRSQRAYIYSKAEAILDAIGMRGRPCIMRTLCEASQLLPNKGNMIHTLLRIIFTIPLELMKREEPAQHWQYRAAQISGLKEHDCQKLFHKCPISLLALALSLRPG